jgi:hypothetical protein
MSHNNSTAEDSKDYETGVPLEKPRLTILIDGELAHYKGNLKNKMLNGKGKLYYKIGDSHVMQASYVNQRFSFEKGYQTIYDEKLPGSKPKVFHNEIIFHGLFINNKLNGSAKWYNRSPYTEYLHEHNDWRFNPLYLYRILYEGEWKDDCPHGIGTVFFTADYVYYGDICCGYAHGQGKLTHEDRVIYQGKWQKGTPIEKNNMDSLLNYKIRYSTFGFTMLYKDILAQGVKLCVFIKKDPTKDKLVLTFKKED